MLALFMKVVTHAKIVTLSKIPKFRIRVSTKTATIVRSEQRTGRYAATYDGRKQFQVGFKKKLFPKVDDIENVIQKCMSN